MQAIYTEKNRKETERRFETGIGTRMRKRNRKSDVM